MTGPGETRRNGQSLWKRAFRQLAFAFRVAPMRRCARFAVRRLRRPKAAKPLHKGAPKTRRHFGQREASPKTPGAPRLQTTRRRCVASGRSGPKTETSKRETARDFSSDTTRRTTVARGFVVLSSKPEALKLRKLRTQRAILRFLMRPLLLFTLLSSAQFCPHANTSGLVRLRSKTDSNSVACQSVLITGMTLELDDVGALAGIARAVG